LTESKRAANDRTRHTPRLRLDVPLWLDRDAAARQVRFPRPERDVEAIWQLSLDATSELISTLTRLRIACDLARRDSVYYARTTEHIRRLRDEHRRRGGARTRARSPRSLRTAPLERCPTHVACTF
jgi:hypothetical protein